MSKNHAEITIPTKSYQKLHGLILQPRTIFEVSDLDWTIIFDATNELILNCYIYILKMKLQYFLQDKSISNSKFKIVARKSC